MKPSEYRINSKESAELFELRLKEFCVSKRISMGYFGVSRAYTLLSATCFDKRCFGAYLDLLLQDIALQEDINVISEKTNIEYENHNGNGFTEIRMDRYTATSNAAHRIRAMWDKIMGFVVLIEHPEEYQKFVKAKSRLAAFQKIRNQCIEIYKGQSDEIVEYLTSDLEGIVGKVDWINDNYRTSEAHSVGRLFKWAFAKQAGDGDPFVAMIEAYKEIRQHLDYLIASIYLIAADSEVS